jgi:hypothetical protein
MSCIREILSSWPFFYKAFGHAAKSKSSAPTFSFRISVHSRFRDPAFITQSIFMSGDSSRIERTVPPGGGRFLL